MACHILLISLWVTFLVYFVHVKTLEESSRNDSTTLLAFLNISQEVNSTTNKTSTRHWHCSNITLTRFGDEDTDYIDKKKINEENITNCMSNVTTDSHYVEILYQNDICRPYASCEYIIKSEFKYCNCDEMCYMYNDCCYDKFYQPNTVDSDQFSFECIQYHTELINEGVYVITTCPPFFPDEELQINCTEKDMIGSGPWVIDSYGRLFRNKYCSKCNGISAYKQVPVKFSNVAVDLLLSMNYKDMPISQKISFLHNKLSANTGFRQKYFKIGYEFVIPSDARKCLIVEPINASPSECLRYSKNPVSVSNVYSAQIYRNIYCVPSEKRENYDVHCTATNYDISYYFAFFPLTVLFSFEENTDDNNGICLSQINEMCPSSDIYSNLNIKLQFSIIASENIPVSLMRQMLLSFAWTMAISNDTLIYEVSLFYAKTRTVNTSLALLNLQIQRQIPSFDLLVSQQQLMQNITWTNRLKTARKVITVYTDKPYYHIREEDDLLESWIFDNHSTLESISSALFLNSSLQVVENLCNEIIIESELLNEIATPVLFLTDINCVKYANLEGASVISEKDSIITYITFCGASMSVISLVISIFICRNYKITDTTHGSNLENLSISLILANVLFLGGVGAEDNQKICVIIGIILHYLWLSVFAFMSITVVNIAIDIRKLNHQTFPSTDQSNFKRYGLTFLGITLPFPLVGPAIVLHYLNVDKFSPKYGGRICFPTKYPANLIFVSGPIMLSILTNIVCLIVLIVWLARQYDEAKKLRKFNAFEQVLLYLRISVITGFFWATGILGAFLKQDILDYLFTVICSLHGLLIFLANITTKRVIRNIKGSLQGRKSTTLTRSTYVIRQLRSNK